jgi:hypothetical protein
MKASVLARAADHLRSTKPPWVAGLPSHSWSSLHALLATDPGLRVIQIEGGDATTKSSLLSLLAKRLSLPEYFGCNWDALEECIRDLEWFPARSYVLVFDHAERLLSRDRQDQEIFVDIMRTAGEEWATRRTTSAPGTPFHVVLLTSVDESDTTRWNVPDLLQTSA